MTARRRPARRSPGRRPEDDWDLPRVTYVYEDPSTSSLRTREIAEFLHDTLGLECLVRRDFFEEHGGPDLDRLAERVAATRVRQIGKPFEATPPSFGEIQFERRLLQDPSKRVPGILYDGFLYANLLRDLLPPRERTLGILHIALAHRILGTYDEDGRYHARAVVCSYPSIVSTSGIVEGPAKPKGYYELKARLAAATGSVPFEAAKEPFVGQFIDYDDDRLTDVVKGYALQCAVYHITKDAFCSETACRLFDAHWQSELIRAQIESGHLCARHRAMASKIRSLRGRS